MESRWMCSWDDVLRRWNKQPEDDFSYELLFMAHDLRESFETYLTKKQESRRQQRIREAQLEALRQEILIELESWRRERWTEKHTATVARMSSTLETSPQSKMDAEDSNGVQVVSANEESPENTDFVFQNQENSTAIQVFDEMPVKEATQNPIDVVPLNSNPHPEFEQEESQHSVVLKNLCGEVPFVVGEPLLFLDSAIGHNGVAALQDFDETSLKETKTLRFLPTEISAFTLVKDGSGDRVECRVLDKMPQGQSSSSGIFSELEVPKAWVTVVTSFEGGTVLQVFDEKPKWTNRDLRQLLEARREDLRELLVLVRVENESSNSISDEEVEAVPDTSQNKDFNVLNDDFEALQDTHNSQILKMLLVESEIGFHWLHTLLHSSDRARVHYDVFFDYCDTAGNDEIIGTMIADAIDKVVVERVKQLQQARVVISVGSEILSWMSSATLAGLIGSLSRSVFDREVKTHISWTLTATTFMGGTVSVYNFRMLANFHP